MSAKHTPGPWSISPPMGTGIEPWFWVSASRTLHLQVSACDDGYVLGENEANARLIAAAPELLEDGQKLLNCLDGNATLSELNEAADKLKQTIAKARGEA